MSSYRAQKEDIVITGMSCRFAESPNPTALWKNILQRKTLFSPLDTEDQKLNRNQKNVFDRPYPRYGGLLNDLYACNPADQYFPRQINPGENQDVFFAVQLAIDALRDSGTSISSLPTDRVSLRLGYAPPFNSASVTWLQHTFFLDQTLEIINKFFPTADKAQLNNIRDSLVKSLPEAAPYSFISALGCAMTSWTAHLLGFAGPAFVLDAGTVSGLQTIQGAIDDLLLRRSDIALAGAIQPPLNRAVLQGLSGAISFSTSDTLQPFSRDSDGTLPGEGGAIFVLKRLKDAVKQNDRIYAIIRSTGIAAASLDQQQRVPTPERLTRSITRALHAARLTQDSIQLLEAHGSGVSHADRTEMNVLQDIFNERRSKLQRIGIGTIKSNIGHTLWASSAAAILKAALCLHHKVLAPNAPIDKPYLSFLSAQSPIYLLKEARPWIRETKTSPRRACISAIDFTGTCAAAILEEYQN
ncbi:MAG: polyketide synthase [Kiritimatiellae bacterium]|nr:polyketide synthase [Kiritimatiellia bacterium]